MKRKGILLVAIATLISLQSPVSALVIDSQIEDELKKEAEKEIIKNAEELSEKITFTKVNSCESMESVMNKFLETYKKLHPKQTRHRYDYPVYYNGLDSVEFATNDIWRATQDTSYNIAWSSKSQSASISREAIATDWAADMWEITDFSTTNIQKVWVDEPEILKSNGNYLFYYTQESYNNKYISIIKTPRKNDLSDSEIVSKIKIPDSLYNIQLFLYGNKLVILWHRYASNYDTVLWSNRTIVIIYDISDLDNLKLEKLSEVYWSFEDARMIWDQLYLISSINLSWYDIARRDEPILFNEMQRKHHLFHVIIYSTCYHQRILWKRPMYILISL